MCTYVSKSIFFSITITLLIVFYSLAGAFEKEDSYNYLLKKEEDRKEIPGNLRTEYPVFTSKRNTRGSNSLLLNNIIKYNFQTDKMENYVTGCKQKYFTNISNIVPAINLNSMGEMNFSSYSDGSISMNINEQIFKEGFLNISIDENILENMFNTNISYTHKLAERTGASIELDIDKENNFSSIFGLKHDLGWSRITCECLFENNDEPGLFDLRWKQKQTEIPGTPFTFSLSAGVLRNMEETWDQSAGILLSHKPLLFGESGMLLFSCSGDIDWEESETVHISGNMLLQFSEDFVINANISRREGELYGIKNINTGGSVGIQKKISEHFIGEISYSFMEDENLFEETIDYFENRDLTGSLYYDFEEGNQVGINAGYNFSEGSFTSIAGDIQINTEDNMFRIAPGYDFEEGNFKIRVETFFIR